jgi:putative ABC transport system substrate-binding protein
MRRRDFITTMAVGTATWPLSIRADQPAQVPLIGVLFADKAESPFSKLFLSAFPKLLQDERGSASGAKTEIKYRFSGGDTDPTRASARELIGMRPAVIVAISNTAMAALHHEATSIPVVFINVSDPVGVGYVDSLARPGHSVTGLTPFEPSLGSKWLSFLKQLAPSIQDAGVIFNPEPGNNSGSFLREERFGFSPRRPHLRTPKSNRSAHSSAAYPGNLSLARFCPRWWSDVLRPP